MRKVLEELEKTARAPIKVPRQMSPTLSHRKLVLEPKQVGYVYNPSQGARSQSPVNKIQLNSGQLSSRSIKPT